jgi:hypothetical protein
MDPGGNGAGNCRSFSEKADADCTSRRRQPELSLSRGLSWQRAEKKPGLANQKLLIGAEVLLDNHGRRTQKESNDAG